MSAATKTEPLCEECETSLWRVHWGMDPTVGTNTLNVAIRWPTMAAECLRCIIQHGAPAGSASFHTITDMHTQNHCT
jgi:hypothetical protein